MNSWIYNEVEKTVKEHTGSQEELIKKLAIQKIEYGRDCINQILSKGGAKELEHDLQVRIFELGGRPKDVKPIIHKGKK